MLGVQVKLNHVCATGLYCCTRAHAHKAIVVLYSRQDPCNVCTPWHGIVPGRRERQKQKCQHDDTHRTVYAQVRHSTILKPTAAMHHNRLTNLEEAGWPTLPLELACRGGPKASGGT